MKTFSAIYTLILFAALMLFSSCKKEIELDLRSVESHLTIEGTIPFDSLAKVSLTKTKDFFSDNSYSPVTGAIVTLSDDAGNTDILSLKPSGLYESEVITGVEGRTYHLRVELDGKAYTATSTMPYAVPIDSVSMFYVPAFGEAFPTVHFIDPKGIDNYYRYIFHINGKKMPGVDVSSDEDRDGKMISRILPYDEEYNDKKKIEQGDKIFIEVQFIDEGAHKFFRSLARMGMSQANPISNIEGGALGYFSAYSFYQTSVMAEW
ncbi:DUF4249 domain-containing protein [Viscerimonas tarda]